MQEFYMRLIMCELHCGKQLQLWDSNVLPQDRQASHSDIQDSELLNLTYSVS